MLLEIAINNAINNSIHIVRLVSIIIGKIAMPQESLLNQH